MFKLRSLAAVLLAVAGPVLVSGCSGGSGGGSTGGGSAPVAAPVGGGSGMNNTQAAAPQKNFVQKHATATSMAAGIAAYKAAKITGQRREEAGGRKNFAQKHPLITGIAAAAITHHYIKKSMH